MMVVSVVVMVIAPVTIPYMLPTFIGQLSGAIVGGMSAAKSGGNIGSGMLFGVVAGTITGGALGGMSEAGYGGFVAGKMAMGAVGGAGAGATSGYAGGKGNIGDIVKSAAIGAGTAAIIAGIAGVLEGDPWLPQSEIGSESVGTGNIAPSSSASSASEASSPGTGAYADRLASTPEEKISLGLAVNRIGKVGVASPYRGVTMRTPFSIAAIGGRVVGYFAVKAVSILVGTAIGAATKNPHLGYNAYQWTDFTLMRSIFDTGTVPGTYGLLDTNPTPAY